MIEKERVETELDLIENLVCKKMDITEVKPLSDKESELLVNLFFYNGDFNIKESEKPFIYKLMEKRIIGVFDYKVEEKGLLFLSGLIDSPGVAVMMCWYLQYKSKKLKIKKFGLKEICEVVIPNGFFTDSGLRKIWEEQKVNNIGIGSDNLLDYKTPGTSLFN